MLNLRRSISVLLLLASSVAVAAEKRAEHVIVISFDGGKPDVMQTSEMPTLDKMAQEGATSWTAQTVFPSITLIAHTSMLTGVAPSKHKVLWNDYRVEKGFVTVPTVFSIAKEKGLSTAMFVGKGKFQHLNVPNTVDTFSLLDYDADLVADAAAKHIAEAKPNLTFVHFADGDGAGHKFGWGSPEQITAFGKTDAALKLIQDAVINSGLKDSTVVIMSADHGGHDKTHGMNTPDDMTIPWIAWGAGVRAGFQIPDAVTTLDTAATALWLLGIDPPEGLDGKPVTSAFDTAAAPVAAAQ